MAELRLRVSLKIHITVKHIEDFIEDNDERISLAAFSEQAFESCHTVFAPFLVRFNVPKEFSRFASREIFDSVAAYNGTRVPVDAYLKFETAPPAVITQPTTPVPTRKRSTRQSSS